MFMRSNVCESGAWTVLQRGSFSCLSALGVFRALSDRDLVRARVSQDVGLAHDLVSRCALTMPTGPCFLGTESTAGSD